MIKYNSLFISFFIIISVAVNSYAQIPVTYYSSCEGKKDSALKNALHLVVNPHTKLSYSDLWTYFPQTDSRPENTLLIWDMYSNNATYFSNHTAMQKEHCVPKSWWNEESLVTESPQYSDLFNLFPSWGEANQAKLNYPLSEVGNNVSYDNASCKVGYSVYSTYTDLAFEPADAYKGDFARTYLYMATCYQQLTSWQTYSYCMFQNDSYPTLKTWAISLLLQWHRQDPVDAKELSRNNAVYNYQSNRNPFIDYPNLAEYIWGNNKGQLWYSSITNSDNYSQNKEFKFTLAGNQIKIESPDNSNVDVFVLNISGSCLKKLALADSTIDISDLPKGMYVLHIVSANQSESFQFVH